MNVNVNIKIAQIDLNQSASKSKQQNGCYFEIQMGKYSRELNDVLMIINWDRP